ncbi:MAG: hypothetical protein LBH66_05745 [Oscillospiraceae bacterium]|jgi:exopolyphosphatase/guanosine-5'-triphosphate,3'-diphosphate pyrophosphatase|nr:hypothetical protein [Oscillospiraceae bacterium]
MDYDAPRAVIGIGSNAVRMLTARVFCGALSNEKRYRVDVRMFSGLAEGKLTTEMISRVTEAVKLMKAEAAADEASAIDLIATSAARDAENSDELAQRIQRETGLVMRVLDGEEEARFGYYGATAGMKGRCGMVDIGGGSTEIAIGDLGEPEEQVSMQLGSSRLGKDMKYKPESVLKALAFMVDGARDTMEVELPKEWVGVGGTLHTLARISLNGERYVEGASLSRDSVESIAYTLNGMTVEQCASVPGILASRADIVEAGAWIALAIMRSMRIEQMTVTERNNMDGFLIEMEKKMGYSLR